MQSNLYLKDQYSLVEAQIRIKLSGLLGFLFSILWCNVSSVAMSAYGHICFNRQKAVNLIIKQQIQVTAIVEIPFS